MRRYALHMLTGAAMALLLMLAVLWFNLNGSVRNGTWIPPSPHTTDYQQMLPALPPVGSADTSRFIAMLERPVFSVTRRPPPPPPPPTTVQAPPPDNLATARLSGVFQGEGVGGVIMLIAGKQRRAQLNELVEGWTLTSVRGQTVTFVKGGQQRILTLERSLLQGAPGANAATSARGASSQAARGGLAYPPAGSTALSGSAPSAFTVPNTSTESPPVPSGAAATQPTAGANTSSPGGSARPPVSNKPTFGGR